MTASLVIAGTLVSAGAYATGWLRLARRARHAPPATWRLAAAMAALAAVAVALASPLAALAHERFSAHMVQHLLLLTVAAPLVLLADPFPVMLWALPPRARAAFRGPFGRDGVCRRALVTVTWLPVAWLVSSAVVWLWHLPALYEWALASESAHVVEHVALLAAAILYWWPLLDPAPRVRGRAHPGGAVAYVVLGAFQAAALGLTLILWPTPLYPSYAGPGREPVDDQALGGVLMWAVTAVVDMAAVMALVWRFLAKAPRAGLRSAAPTAVPTRRVS